MVEVVEPTPLTLRESLWSTKPCLLEAFSEEELLNSVLPCLKDLVGMSPIIPLLNPTSMVKVKDVHSSPVLAALPALNSTNFAQDLLEDALPMVEEVENVPVILLWTDANSSILMKIMTVKTQTEKTMQDYLNSRSSEEELAANVLLVI